ncbi:MAG: DUF4007 family protein [Gammaproteobacteria bacterium]|nr:DUF4007 family protein [Gammaproteobacteria bacterium]
MRLSDAAKPTFARHETFHPRYGWFRKAYATAATRERGFSEPDAPVNMGVGKNMVRAIKFWGEAAKIITKDPQSANQRAPEMVPTRFGHSLFADDGWDPYMEDPGTIWLLHWLLLAPTCHLPVWWLAFNELHFVEFDEETLDAATRGQLEASSWRALPHQSSIRKDISALLRTYAPTARSGRSTLDDLLDCPLRELGLIGGAATAGNYRFVQGAKPTLPGEIVLFAIFDYLSRRPPPGNTATLSQLANEAGAPGRAFKLTEGDLAQALEAAVDELAEVALMSSAIGRQLSWKCDVSEAAAEVLRQYYGEGRDDARAGVVGDLPADHASLPIERSGSMARLREASERQLVGAAR